MARRFADLSEQEILALAISNEEEDSRIYADIDHALRADYPATAKVFEGMEAEEQEHRRVLMELYRTRFGEHIPLIRREDVKGFIRHKPVWLVRPLGIEAVRRLVETIELETR
ncbi:MAG TPA: ferritin family protein, partial [Tepidisphaeraceae bacterium]|nr:ferritin family protein [Tepidisphaeraceae bacterium]